jgi:hypothetical protein
MAIRRTQREIDAKKAASKAVADMTREELQAEAKARGIKANQSTDALRDALK